MGKAKKNKDNYIYSYYQAIKDEKVCVGRWIRLLYEYIIKGLESEQFFFDQKKANNSIEWIEQHCFHTEGPLAPNSLILSLWQKALLSIMYGIVDKNGKRQFREVILIVARKNGKSLFASAIAKYEWYVDAGFGGRIFCLAPKLDQADIIYNSIWQQTMLDPEWQQLKEEIENSVEKTHGKRMKDDSELARHRQTDLLIPATNSTIKKIAFSSKKSDGFNPSLTICDEIASWNGDQGLKQYEVMKSAMGAREMGENPSILLSCSTSGYINDSIYDELIKRATRFLLGDSKEKRLLPFLYMIDDVEKWNDINELRKSNPNLGISVSVDYLLEEIAIAEGSLSKKAEFITKYCNLKQNSSLAWLETQVIEKAFTQDIDLEDFRGCYAVAGVDLSQTTDLTACVLAVEKNRKIYIFSKFFLPAEKIEEATARDGLPYNLYIQQGYLMESGENFIDYHDCYRWFTDLVEKYEIYPLQVGYDRYSAQYLVQDMSTYGFHMDDVYQGDNLYPVLMEFEGLIKDGTVVIVDNPLMKVHLANAAIKFSVERNRGRLVKITQTQHIDGVAALMDAMCVRQKYYGEIGGQLANE